MTTQKESVLDALNRLAKWRSVFAGWQLGTRSDDDPECQAVRDHRELSMLMRAELSSLSQLLILKGVFTQEEWEAALAVEARQLSQDYAEKFPGFVASDWGMDIDVNKALETTKNWRK